MIDCTVRASTWMPEGWLSTKDAVEIDDGYCADFCCGWSGLCRQAGGCAESVGGRGSEEEDVVDGGTALQGVGGVGQA